MVDSQNVRLNIVGGRPQSNFKVKCQFFLNPNEGTGSTFRNGQTARDVRLYNRQKNGVEGSPILEFFGQFTNVLSTNVNRLDRYLQLDLSLNEIKLFNTVDYIELETNGVIDRYFITLYNYLVQTSPNIWAGVDIDYIKSRFTLSGEISQVQFTDYEGKINAPYDKSSYDIFFTGLTGITDLTELVLPINLPTLESLFSFTGTIADIELIKYDFHIGRISDRDPDLSIKPEVVSIFVPPTNPPDPVRPRFTPQIVSVSLDENDLLVCTYDIFPTPDATDFMSLEINQQLVSGIGGGFQSRTTNNHAQRVITGFAVLEGQSARIRLSLRDIDNNLVRTELIVYTRKNNVLTVEDNFYEMEEIKSSKIHVTKVRDTTLDLLIINDSFNDEFITSIIATIEQAGNDIVVTVLNNMLSSQLEIKITGLTANTLYALKIEAVSALTTFLIQRISVYTTISIPDPATPEQIKEKAMQEIIRMAYEPETVDEIEVLEVTEQGFITRDILKAILEPTNLGLTMDRNHFNRKGNVFNDGKSEAVKANYPKTIEQILENNTIGIPDIDEGYA